MRAKDILSQLGFADREFLEAAGPAVLRLKLLEASYLSENRRLPEEMREAARQVAEELRRLILERPSVSLIDRAAKEEVDARRAARPVPILRRA
ncbi:hypothetical protein [Methylocystis echinoides]|jgi:hypothetical protein|uniref:hypothetical protein n=1 Tax=Methylocystis echinoides TaxID=29468 RepID=UPI00343A78F0